MNDEIKEILEIFKQVDLELEAGGCYNCPKKDKDKTCIGCLNNAKEKLLDYITNLQHTEDLYNELLKDYDELQQRIEKAVEYIQNHQLVFELSSKKVISQWFDMFYKDTLNILNGRSDE